MLTYDFRKAIPVKICKIIWKPRRFRLILYRFGQDVESLFSVMSLHLMAKQGQAWHNMVPHGTTWYNMARHGTTWYNMA